MNTERTSRISRSIRYALMTGLLLITLAPGQAAADVVEWFTRNPLTGGGGNAFFAEGDTAGRFRHLRSQRRRFAGDRPGALRVVYDTTLPQARVSTPINSVPSFNDSFEFGAILTIRSRGFFADPDGFSQIAFGLWNSATTGFGRTSFPSDSYDLLEFNYFPNVTSFGGPFLSPTVFGGEVGANAFFNFAFTSAAVALPLDVPLLCRFVHDGAARRLTLTVSAYHEPGGFVPIPGAVVAVDTGILNPTFLVDALGIAGYFEGFASLHAVVIYDLLYMGRLPRSITARSGRTPVLVPEDIE